MGKKMPVSVIAQFTSRGLVPLSLIWYDGRCFPVDTVLDMQRPARPQVGRPGMRYVVRIRGQQRVLWRDADAWFIEKAEGKA